MENRFEFIPAALIVNGKTFPASYENLPGRVVIVAEVQENGKKAFKKIEVPETDINYLLAYAVADETARKAAEPAPETSAPETSAEPVPDPKERPETISPAETDKEKENEIMKPETMNAAETERPETISAEEASAPDRAPIDKPARGPAKPKEFAGEALSGKGWSIVFDTGLNRTRVIVADPLREKLAPMIENAGFFFSKSQNSWNKKLTHKAHRAAIALADNIRTALAS